MDKYKILNRILIGICVLLLILCVSLFTLIHLNDRSKQNSCTIFMNGVYTKLSEIAYIADSCTNDGNAGKNIDEQLIELHYRLIATAEYFEIGQQFVDECIPGNAAMWFLIASSSISKLQNENCAWSEQANALKQLNHDINKLLSEIADPNQTGIMPSLSIEEFSGIILNFYFNAAQ